jgi:hypothetical protein
MNKPAKGPPQNTTINDFPFLFITVIERSDAGNGVWVVVFFFFCEGWGRLECTEPSSLDDQK